MNDDFIVTSEEKTFLAGTSSGSVCVVILLNVDDVMEAPEMFLVTINSSDTAVSIAPDTAMVQIINRIPGESIMN